MSTYFVNLFQFEMVAVERIALSRLTVFETGPSAVRGKPDRVGTPGRGCTDNARALRPSPLLLGYWSKICSVIVVTYVAHWAVKQKQNER